MAESVLSVDELKDILASRNIKPSLQRISVLKHMMEHRSHPSVDTIYKDLSAHIPTLSKTTVYNTLNQLTDKGIIAVLNIDGVEAKYEYAEEAHAHFLCTKCHTIYDVELNTDLFNTMLVDGHHVTEAQIHFRGICKDCRLKED